MKAWEKFKELEFDFIPGYFIDIGSYIGPATAEDEFRIIRSRAIDLICYYETVSGKTVFPGIPLLEYQPAPTKSLTEFIYQGKLRKLKMSELNAKNLKPKMLVESISEGIYAVDRDRKIIYWGSSAERITGWRSKDILGKRCSDGILCHVDKDGRPLCGEERCPLHRTMVTNQGTDLPFIVFANSYDGRRMPMYVSTAPIRNKDGEVIGGVETFRDASLDQHDLDLTKRIQSAMFKRHLIQDENVTFTAHYLPWSTVGGNYYAATKLDEDSFAFMFADVCGHGVVAALYTVYLNSLWHNHYSLMGKPAQIARAINNELSELNSDDMQFATAIFGLLDLKKECVTLTFAGGPAPFLYPKGGNMKMLKGSGLPLGIQTGVEYTEVITAVNPGDCLLMFSDGALEVSNLDGEELGNEGLARILKEHNYPESRDFNAIDERLLKFSDWIRFNDDLTFFEIRLR